MPSVAGVESRAALEPSLLPSLIRKRMLENLSTNTRPQSSTLALLLARKERQLGLGVVLVRIYLNGPTPSLKPLSSSTAGPDSRFLDQLQTTDQVLHRQSSNDLTLPPDSVVQLRDPLWSLREALGLTIYCPSGGIPFSLHRQKNPSRKPPSTVLISTYSAHFMTMPQTPTSPKPSPNQPLPYPLASPKPLSNPPTSSPRLIENSSSSVSAPLKPQICLPWSTSTPPTNASA